MAVTVPMYSSRCCQQCSIVGKELDFPNVVRDGGELIFLIVANFQHDGEGGAFFTTRFRREYGTKGTTCPQFTGGGTLGRWQT